MKDFNLNDQTFTVLEEKWRKLAWIQLQTRTS